MGETLLFEFGVAVQSNFDSKGHVADDRLARFASWRVQQERDARSVFPGCRIHEMLGVEEPVRQ